MGRASLACEAARAQPIAYCGSPPVWTSALCAGNLEQAVQDLAVTVEWRNDSHGIESARLLRTGFLS